jgi:hypothetical protein
MFDIDTRDDVNAKTRAEGIFFSRSRAARDVSRAAR